MVPAAFGVLGAAVGDEGAEAWVGAPAELAAEGAVRVALERFVVRSVRIVHAAVGHQRAERRVLLAAVDAEERAVLVALEESVPSLPESARMMGAGIREQALCIRVLLSAVLAVFAQGSVPYGGGERKSSTAARAGAREKSKGRANDRDTR